MSNRLNVLPSASVSSTTCAVTALLAAPAAVLIADAMSANESLERSIVTLNPPIVTDPEAGGVARPASVAMAVVEEMYLSLFAPSEVLFLIDVVVSRYPREPSTPADPSARSMPAAPVSSAVSTRR